MSEVPSELKYSKSHEWVRLEDDGSVTIGITEHAQELLGDMVFVELPDLETDVNSGDECGVVESVKAASDIYAPVSGFVVAINEELSDAPEIVNSDPYGGGWIFRLKLRDDAEMSELLDADAYEEHIAD
ncbi:MAG: glycine cleavage system protein H [Legionellales bacterium]|nr:glycine cleavage system protein H [Legionellales bacterium]